MDHFLRDIECGFNGRVNLQLVIVVVTYFLLYSTRIAYKYYICLFSILLKYIFMFGYISFGVHVFFNSVLCATFGAFRVGITSYIVFCIYNYIFIYYVCL